ncbi:MAG TPA: DNA helicase, partial [Lachnospiraceae bacterium]|nr:DNA helicase [Lachnospiraceae bacterium]
QIYVLMQYFPQAKFMMLGDEFQAIRPGTASFAQIREIFESAGKEVKELSLMTSYRSSPEITNLFVKLLPDDLRGKTASVRRPGLEPKIETAEGDEAYAKLLRDSVSELQGSEGLTAVICENRRSLKKVRSILQDLDIPTIDPGDHLPKEGIFLIELSLCKGLEFDNVILPDVDANRYPDETLSRHRLYTAISRAMQKLIILAQDHISPMLED